MPVDERRRVLLSRYRCDLRYVVGSRASAYGYTLTVWFTGMVLSHAYLPIAIGAALRSAPPR
jgi:hypothetical protein